MRWQKVAGCASSCQTKFKVAPKTMHPIQSKPISQISVEDVRSLFGWPESESLEFKRTLPGRDGRSDPWMDGREFDRTSRDKLFKEVVAFANSFGGTLVLGIGESDQIPAVAGEILSLPRCQDLAERLERAASQAIDPPIPMLVIKGIVAGPDGSGIVLFRTPASSSAPHRAPDKECYVRRGANSVPMTMREIQEMTLNAARRENWVDGQFSIASANFRKWLRDISDEAVGGFRITAVPMTARFEIERVFAKSGLIVGQDSYRVGVDGGVLDSTAILWPSDERPLVRGSRRTYNSGSIDGTYLDIYCNGCVDFGLRVRREREQRDGIYQGWILGHSINVLRTVDNLRAAGGAADCEYAVEVEIGCTPDIEKSSIQILGASHSVIVPLGQVVAPFVLPRIPFRQLSTINDALSLMLTDIGDAAGARFAKRAQVSLELGAN